eukprot:3729169-Rhodomonas_salina.2
MPARSLSPYALPMQCPVSPDALPLPFLRNARYPPTPFLCPSHAISDISLRPSCAANTLWLANTRGI